MFHDQKVITHRGAPADEETERVAARAPMSDRPWSRMIERSKSGRGEQMGHPSGTRDHSQERETAGGADTERRDG